jgi:hypothetical protein
MTDQLRCRSESFGETQDKLREESLSPLKVVRTQTEPLPLSLVFGKRHQGQVLLLHFKQKSHPRGTKATEGCGLLLPFPILLSSLLLLLP